MKILDGFLVFGKQYKMDQKHLKMPQAGGRPTYFLA